jgi:cell division protease FtsH
MPARRVAVQAMSFPILEDAPSDESKTQTTAPRSTPSRVRGGGNLLESRWARSAVAASLALALAGTAWWWSARTDLPAPVEVSYTQMLAGMEAGRIEAITVIPGREIRATLAAPEPGGAEWLSVYPVSSIDELSKHAAAAEVELTLKAATRPRSAAENVSLVLQLALLGVLSYLLFMQFRGSRGGAGIGKEGASQTTFSDVAGTQGAAEELRELVEFLKRPDQFAAVGARIPKGALLVGPPGTGKTLLARAVAGEAGVPFFSISGSEVTGFLVGLGAQRVKALFRKARKKGGVIFIDEIDALGGKRGRNQSHNEDDRTLNQLLVEMDGFAPSDGVVVLGATNRVDDLDPALRRPGRFDRTITVGLPTVAGRADILELHARNRQIPLGGDVELARLARLTPQSSGAELANLLNEAAISAAREGATAVGWRHIEQARDRFLLGKERVGFRASEMELLTVAYHEAGHAIAGVVCCPEDGLHKVTIQPRGQAMGVAFFSPDSDRFLYRRSYLEGQIIKGLAGRAAEELVFGARSVTSGAQSDLMQVNSIARKMVYEFGMGESCGLMVNSGEPGALSAQAHARMDEEVKQILGRLYGKAIEVIRANRDALEALAQALLERETLDGADAVAVMDAHGVARPVPPPDAPAPRRLALVD